MLARILIGVALAIGLAAPAHAGLLDPITSCTLSLTTPGALTMAPDGRSLGSQNAGGSGAVMALVSLTRSEIVFSSPALVGPTGWSATPSTMIAVETLSGTRTGYSASPITVRPGVLLDTLTIHSRVASTTGFLSGSYSVASQVTCQAA